MQAKQEIRNSDMSPDSIPSTAVLADNGIIEAVNELWRELAQPGSHHHFVHGEVGDDYFALLERRQYDYSELLPRWLAGIRQVLDGNRELFEFDNTLALRGPRCLLRAIRLPLAGRGALLSVTENITGDTDPLPGQSQTPLTEAPPICLYEIDPAWNVRLVNCSAADFDTEQVLGRPLLQRFPEADRPRFGDLLQQAFGQGKAAWIEYSIPESSRGTRICIAQILPIHRGPRVDSALLAVHDVTEIQAARQQANQRDAELASVFEALPDLYFRVAPDGTILDYRAQTLSELYVPPQRFLGRRIQDLMPSPVARLWERHQDRLQQGHVGVSFEYQLPMPDGEQHFEARLGLLPNSDDIIVVVRDITEHREAQKQLLESNRRLEDAQRVAQIGSWEWDMAVDRANWSTELYRIFGLDPEHFVPSVESVAQCLHPEDQDRLRRQIEVCITGGERPPIELRLLRPDGTEHIISSRAEPRRDETGRVRHLTGTVQDITVRKRVERALLESEERFRRMVEFSWDMFTLVDKSGRIEYVSEAVERILGYRISELAGANTLGFVYPPDLSMARKLLSELMTNPSRPMIAEIRLHHRDGSWRWVEIAAKNLLEDPSLKAIVVNIRDVTDRKTAEDALFDEKERAQVTLHSIGDAVITTDRDGRVDYLNPVAQALTGWRLAEASGRNLDEVFHILDENAHEPLQNPVERCLREDKAVGLSNLSVLVSRDGSRHDVDDSAAPIRGRDGSVLGAVLVFHDVSETRRLTRKMAHDAAHDALTGLVNRREFEARLHKALESSRQYGVRHALCYLDLDQFKIVNDTAGHTAGDELLRQIKDLLAGTFRDRDTLARLGGDEFGLLLDNCPLQRALSISGQIVGAIRDYRFVWQGQGFQVGASVGVVPITQDSASVAKLLSQADVACYTAKEMGRNRVHVYDTQGGAPAQRHSEILRAARLRDALEQDRFRLFCQPIIPLTTAENEPQRYELLLRLLDDDGNMVLPGAFIPAAERFGLMGALDRWAIRAGFEAYTGLSQHKDIRISVNLSGNSLNDEHMPEYVQSLFDEFRLPPERVCFEITETAAVNNLAQTSSFMHELKDLGSQLALDDFGSGLSSFRYLKTLPVDYLKIDGSFVQGIEEDSRDLAIVAAINQLGHSLGTQTIAEYASSEYIVERLRKLGVDYAQGYALGHPLPFAILD